MYKNIEFEQLINNGINNYILIDVRSPKEHLESAVPGAINIPIFSNSEHQLVGTVYQQESVEKAKKIGIEIVSRKLPDIYDAFMKLEAENKGKQLVIYCARGGLRSSSIVSLFTTLGINVFKLRGGYKSYRQYIVSQLPEVNSSVKYIVLHGNTGVGKTQILKMLESRGHDVLDLEACANHRGSLLGSVGLGLTNTQKQFDALIFNSLKYRKSDYVFVEAESKRIGNIFIPDYIFESMKKGIHINLTADIDFRAKLLIDEYTAYENSDAEIQSALNNLNKYIGEKNWERYQAMLVSQNYIELAVELMKKYYDPMYENESRKYDYSLELKVEDIESCVLELEKWWNSRSFE